MLTQVIKNDNMNLQRDIMKYEVIWKNKIEKRIKKCPLYIQQKFWLLIDDLRKTGPIQNNWANFSAIGKNLYHCHLDYSWVAVWYCDKGSIIIEVTYAGSREDAPY